LALFSPPFLRATFPSLPSSSSSSAAAAPLTSQQQAKDEQEYTEGPNRYLPDFKTYCEVYEQKIKRQKTQSKQLREQRSAIEASSGDHIKQKRMFENLMDLLVRHRRRRRRRRRRRPAVLFVRGVRGVRVARVARVRVSRVRAFVYIAAEVIFCRVRVCGWAFPRQLRRGLFGGVDWRQRDASAWAQSVLLTLPTLGARAARRPQAAKKKSLARSKASDSAVDTFDKVNGSNVLTIE
jgi:hypothetical protein